ncbi:MAG: class I SAM-dependent methyltransferase [bacterium]|nr:class I SAM-dependent methyltransferase [bacterium]
MVKTAVLEAFEERQEWLTDLVGEALSDMEIRPMDRWSHWNKVYETKDPTRVSWFQSRPETSLRLIANAGLDPSARILDVGGGTSILVDALLAIGYQQPGVLDVSEEAIQRTRARLATRAEAVEWYVEDVTRFKSPHRWDLWHDRAVLHFLTTEEDQRAYRKVLGRSLAEEGHVVIATFGPEGPGRCSGLDVVQYDVDRMQRLLGEGFELKEWHLEDHVTPSGAIQQFLFCRFFRVSSEVETIVFKNWTAVSSQLFPE